VRAAALAVLGAVGLAVSAAFPWFRFDTAHFCGGGDGWTCYAPLTDLAVLTGLPVARANALGGLGPVTAVALALCVLAMFAAAVLVVRGGVGARGPLTVALGASVGATALLVVRVVTQPGLGHGYPNRLVDVTPAAWIGVGFAVLATLGVALARRAAPRASLS